MARKNRRNEMESEMIRVSREFKEILAKISQETGKNRTQVTREIARRARE